MDGEILMKIGTLIYTIIQMSTLRVKGVIVFVLLKLFLIPSVKDIITGVINKAGNIEIISYTNIDKSFSVLIKEIKAEKRILLHVVEAYHLYSFVKATANIEGDIAEVGVYKGGSAKIICETRDNSKSIHLFDTFEGLPYETTEKIDEVYEKGHCAASFDDTKEYLSEYNNVYFYKGIFPLTATPVKDKVFSFVNLDVNVYRSTFDCLTFFYIRMSPGGIIISHDYTSKGIKKAFDIFFKDKPEVVIKLVGSHCMVVKSTNI